MELLSQKFKFDIPDIWNKLTIKAKERNGVISPAAQVEFTNWIVYAENLKLEDIIEVRRLKFAQRAGLLKTRTVQTLGQVIESLKQRFITSELLSSSPLPSSSTRWAAGKPLSLEYHASSSSTPTTSTTPHCASSSSSSSSSTSAASMCSYSSSPTPSEQQASSDNKFINPARELVLAFLRSNWESYLKWTNEEKAEFIEIADTSSAYHRDGSDCREQMLGLRVKVRYQFGAPALAIRKECVRACFEVFKDAIVESLPRIWGSEQEDNFIRLLCCNGSRCGRKEEIVVIHGGGGVYDAMAAEPGGACLLKARMDVVDVLGTDEIYIWLRMGHDEEWIQSNPPPHTAKVVPLAYVFQTL